MNTLYLLKQHHLKATPQRVAMIQLMEIAGHISIEELYQHIRGQFSSISLATLYKNINKMVDKSLVREVKIPGQKTRYEIEKTAHAHLLCNECGELKDMEFDVEKLLDEAGKNSHYQPKEVTIVVSGLCPTCKEQ